MPDAERSPIERTRQIGGPYGQAGCLVLQIAQPWSAFAENAQRFTAMYLAFKNKRREADARRGPASAGPAGRPPRPDHVVLTAPSVCTVMHESIRGAA